MAGFAIGGGNVGIHGSLNGTLLKNGYELTGRISTQQKFTLNFGNSINSRDYVNEYALLVGKNVTRHPISHFVFSAGIALVDVVNKGEGTPILNETSSNYFFYAPRYRYELIHRYTVGVPVEMKYFNNFLRLVPVTVSFGTNVNPKQSFYYLTLGVQFGNTRERLIKNSGN